MANFGVSILDSNLDNDITVSIGIATIIDHSNYEDNTEAGHDQNFFDDYRKIYITDPQGTEYVFSTLYPSDGSDALISTPAPPTTLPITTTYVTTGDGVYELILEAVPTWNEGETYSLTNQHHVYYDGSLYKCLQNSNLDKQPDVETSYWEEVDAEDLPEKYRIEAKFYVIDDLMICFQQSAYTAICAIESLACKECLCDNAEFLKAVEVGMLIYHIPILATNDEWDRIISVINLGSQLCSCSSSNNPCNCN